MYVQDSAASSAISGLSLQPQQQEAAPGTPASEAERILQIGVRDGTDDYAARLDAFTEVMDSGDAAFRDALMQEIMDRDPDAINSWLNPVEINAAVDSGLISSQQRAAIAESLAAAYNDGHPALAPGDPVGHPPLSRSPLDAPLYEYHSSTGSDSGQVQRSLAVSGFVEFIGSSQGPEAALFRTDYSRHLIDQYVLPGTSDSHRSAAAAGLAASLMSGDPARPDLTVRALSGYDPSELERIFGEMEASRYVYAESPALMRETAEAGIDITSVTLPESLTQVYAAIARSSNPDAGPLALDVARVASRNQGWFDSAETGDLGSARLDALMTMVVGHDETILDALTEYDRSGARSISDVGRIQYEVNASELGQLFQLTLFNPDAVGLLSHSDLQGSIIQYAGDLTAQINAANDGNAAGFDEPAGRLAMLSAATDNAIAQGYADLRDQQAARLAQISFIVDLVLVAVPASSRTREKLVELVGGVLPEGVLDRVLERVSGNLVDRATGRLTNEAKQAIAEVVGEDEAHLIEQQGLQTGFKEALVSGIDNEERRFNVITRADGIASDVAENH